MLRYCSDCGHWFNAAYTDECPVCESVNTSWDLREVA